MGHAFPLNGLKGMAVQMHIDHLIRIVIEEVVDLVLGLDGKAASSQKMVVAILPVEVANLMSRFRPEGNRPSQRSTCL
jgi:hypothetical protein